MSIFRRHQTRAWDATSLIAAERSGRTSSRMVRQEQALRHSAVWAARRLRADLISTTPLDVFRETAGGHLAQIPTPPVLREPDGEIDVTEWFYSSQADLDDVGNAFGLIRGTDRAGLPAAVELLPADPTIADHLGDAYWRVGRKLEAKFQWQHAKDNKPEPEDLKLIEEKLKNGLPDVQPVTPVQNAAPKTNG